MGHMMIHNTHIGEVYFSPSPDERLYEPVMAVVGSSNEW